MSSLLFNTYINIVLAYVNILREKIVHHIFNNEVLFMKQLSLGTELE